MSPMDYVDSAMLKAISMIVLCSMALFCTFCFSKKLLGQLDANAQERDGSPRNLWLLSASVNQGLSAIWYCSLIFASMFIVYCLTCMIIAVCRDYPRFSAGLGH